MTKPPDLSKAAAALGRKGGQSTSEAKQAAARANGKRGGRPRKQKGENEMANKVQKNLKDDYEYLIVAAKSAPTKKERDWAKRQLTRLEKKSSTRS